ncbi:MAG: protein-disulfide reductase DsbD family protein [Burkholderiaceae bacterium]|nr:protein-disulfide reductase DsbD family protein [Burkholderiaceae bacterium]
MKFYSHRLRHAALFVVFAALVGSMLGVLSTARAQAPAARAQAHSVPVAGPVRVDSVEVELVADRAAVVPGEPMRLGLRIRHDPQWHTYWRNPGDSGLPTQVELRLPQGFEAGAIRWPAPQRLFIPPLANYGYEGEIVLPMALQPPRAIDGERVTIAAHASWLMCRDVCIPGDADVSLALPVQHAGPAAPSSFVALFDDAERRMPQSKLAAQVHDDGDAISIALPRRASNVEFFPYQEGFVENAAEQVLFAVTQPADGVRLAVRLSEDGVRKLRESGESLLAAASGVVVVDGTAYETDAKASTAALPVGTEIARVAGAASQPPAGASSRGSWLPGFGASSSGRGVGLSSTATSRDAVSGSSPAAGAQPPSTARTLWIAALFGAIGGLILNLMPCVFPVIGLKVLGFARTGGEADASSRLGALAFAAGVVVSFWALAAMLLALRAGGEAAGWGFQLQSPAFVAAMAMLFVAIGLNFSGVYEVGVAMTRLGALDAGSRPHPLLGSFGSGVLAVLVATPCTAPFMGSAMGFTLASSAGEAMVVFTAIALGMAAPYVLLGFFPQALRVLPKPGRWMETFRQALAFPMYATAAWLAWVLGQQAGIDAVFALAIGAVLVALAAWLYGRFVQQGVPRTASRVVRPLAGVLSAAAFAVGLWTAWPGEAAAPPAASAAPGAPSAAGNALASAWQPWSEERVREARDAKQPVFVDFTAAWCVSCQANKRLVLERDSIVAEMAERGVLRLKADWTNRDPRITEALARFGRNGVPLYLVYRPDEPEPRVLPELLTMGIVRAALAGLPPAKPIGADAGIAQRAPDALTSRPTSAAGGL